MLPGTVVPGCSLVSFHFLWAILCSQAVDPGIEVVNMQDHATWGPPFSASLYMVFLTADPHSLKPGGILSTL